MNFYVATLFPDLIRTAVNTSITGRAISNGVFSVETINIRDYSVHGTKRVDDYPYGGGAGMVMEAEPVFQAVHAIEKKLGHRPRVIYLTPQAKVLTQPQVEALAQEEELVLLCGHYEGIDDRVLEEVVTDYISIGDYVLTGGELAAAVLIDAVSRFIPGVLHNEESSQFESLQDNLLEYPHYTRPEVWHDKAVPEVLLSGDHGKIDSWRYEQSLLRTAERRPDLLKSSYRVLGIWFGNDACREMADTFCMALSRYGTVLDYNRKKLQKQNHNANEKELLVFSLPDDPEAEMAFCERFRNIRGIHTPVILLYRNAKEHLFGVRAFLLERGFYILQECQLHESDRIEDLVREWAVQIHILMEKQ